MVGCISVSKQARPAFGSWELTMTWVIKINFVALNVDGLSNGILVCFAGRFNRSYKYRLIDT